MTRTIWAFLTCWLSSAHKEAPSFGHLINIATTFFSPCYIAEKNISQFFSVLVNHVNTVRLLLKPDLTRLFGCLSLSLTRLHQVAKVKLVPRVSHLPTKDPGNEVARIKVKSVLPSLYLYLNRKLTRVIHDFDFKLTEIISSYSRSLDEITR